MPRNGHRTMMPDSAKHLTRRGLGAIVILFVVLASYYNLATPIFEASDEVYHYPYVHYVATEHRLPVQDPDDIQLWRQEGSQPPLYYLLSAAATVWIDTGDFPQRLVHNPHAKIGIPLAPDNKNLVVHTTAEQFPYRGTTLAVHIIRLLSTLMGAGSVALTFLIVREVLPGSTLLPLMAAATTAFNPMFLFISASVNNDNLTILLCSLALWLIVRLLRHGATPGRVAGIGVVVGLAILTKMSAIGLLVLVALAITWDAWHRRSSFRTWLGYGLLAASLVAAIGGWWYIRNWLLYGDLMGFSAWLAIAGTREHTPTAAKLLAEFEGFRISYWGLFGGVNVLMHPLLYKVYDTLTVLAVIGLLVGGVRWVGQQRRQSWRTILSNHYPRIAQLIILGLWPLILLAALARWTSLTEASQGRLIFPAIAAVSFWLALGWQNLTPRRWRKVTLAGVATGLLVIAVMAPLAFIAPAYTLPASSFGLPDTLEPLSITYGDRMELVGYRLPSREILSGQTLTVELGWRALTPMEEKYSIFVHLYGRDDEFLGQADTYPGGGLFPTNSWLPDEEFRDVVHVPVTSDAQAPAVGRIVVGLYTFEDMSMLPAHDPQGAELGTSPTIGRFKIATSHPPSYEVQQPADYQFGRRLKLIGYDLSAAPGQITLYWQALEPVAVDYTVFVHLLDAEGSPVAQADSQPQSGAYPTSWWSAAEVIEDTHTMPPEIVENLPPGRYTLNVGLYNLDTGERLVVTADGQQQGDHIVLGPVTAP
jgi:4-amino-4-deoxy-L-arabinose transferase-like glycosyltransferase